MRLRDYQKLLEENIPLLEINCETVPNNLTLKKITKYIKAMKAIHVFEDNKLFLDIIPQISQYKEIYNNNYEPFITQASICNAIINSVQTLSQSAKTLKLTIDSILVQEEENCIYFKLPEYKNIEELNDFFDSLKIILHVFKYVGNEPEFKGFDVGSEYVLFCFCAINFVILLYQIADKSLALRNKKLEGDKSIAEIEKLKSEKRSLDINNIEKLMNDLKLVNEEEYSNLKDRLIEEIVSIAEVNVEEKDKNEFKNCLSKALDKIGVLLEKGMKLIPASSSAKEIIQASNELDKYLKSYQNAFIGMNEIKLITENNKNDDKK